MRSLTSSEIELIAPPGTYPPHKGMRPVAEEAADRLPPDGTLLDLGCGVGAIALWVVKNRPDCWAYGVDINSLAVEAARANAQTLGIDACFAQGDLYEPVGEFRFDVITITVPWEPPSAYNHPEPADAYIDRNMTMARALAGASEHLHAGGHAIVFAQAGLNEAIDMAGLQVCREKVGADYHIYVAEAIWPT